MRVSCLQFCPEYRNGKLHPDPNIVSLLTATLCWSRVHIYCEQYRFHPSISQYYDLEMVTSSFSIKIFLIVAPPASVKDLCVVYEHIFPI